MHLVIAGLLLISGAALGAFLYGGSELLIAIGVLALALQKQVLLFAVAFASRKPMQLMFRILRTISLGAFVGSAKTGRFRRFALQPVFRMSQHGRTLWQNASVMIRSLIIVVALCAIALFGWSLIVIPLLLPFAGPLIRRLYFWIADTFFDKGSRPMHRWWNRIRRRHHRLKALFRPLRNAEAALRRAIETWREAQMHKRSRKHEKPPVT